MSLGHCFTLRGLSLAASCIAIAATSLRGQASRVVSVVGIAYDSLHNSPLHGALVMMGASRVTLTDSVGMFRFDSVAPGTYPITLQHDILDSIGFSGANAKVVISDGRDTVHVGIPSFTTFWRETCGGLVPPDSGFVFGVVRAAEGRRPLAGATVAGSWVELGGGSATGYVQRRLRLDVVTDSAGNYALCGLPTETGTRIRAATDSLASGLVDLLLGADRRIQRRDLLLGPAALGDNSLSGTVIGTVTVESGRPLPQAIVSADGVADVRTNNNGRFVIRGVAAGTQQIEIKAIGMMSTLVTVDVMPRDTVSVSAVLSRVTLLDSVVTRSEAMRQRIIANLDERRTKGMGYFRDSTSIPQAATLAGVVSQVPSVTIIRGRMGEFSVLFPAPGSGKCAATVWIDGFRSRDQSELSFIRAEDIALIEAYPRGASAPMEFMPPGALTTCGALVIWTKWKVGK